MHLLMFYMNTPIAYLNPGFRQNINYNSIICTKQFCLFFYETKIMGNFITWLLGKSHDKNCNCSAVIQQLLARNCFVHEARKERRGDNVSVPRIHYPQLCIQDTNFIDLQRKLLHESYSFMKAVDKCIENIGVSMSVYLVLENKIGNRWAFQATSNREIDSLS